jgi:putative sugar O-methyltransferase
VGEALTTFPGVPLPVGPSPGLGDLQEMFDELMDADPIFRPSKFWENLVRVHLTELREDGFEHFKRTVNRRYFQFQILSPFHPLARGLWLRWLRQPRLAPLRARFLDGHAIAVDDSFIGRRRADSYAIYIALLADRVAELDRSDIFSKLEEPLVGDPICIDYRDRRVSEDLCNSVSELLAVKQALPEGELDHATVIELGSGYGWLAWTYLTVFPEVRYVLVDIPPALALAEQYLTSTFPDRRVFGFRRFGSAAEVAEELADAQIAFLTPNQLELLPELRARVFLNVSSLHEMTPDQIAHYLGVIDRHTDGWFYTKQWIRSQNTDDGVVIQREDYPIPAGWNTQFNLTNELNPAFFEALYCVGES